MAAAEALSVPVGLRKEASTQTTNPIIPLSGTHSRSSRSSPRGWCSGSTVRI